jgi:heat shock protein HslJ
VIATRTIAPAGQVPIPFDLKFDPSRIDERMSYSVSARIMDGGRLQFISDTHNPVLTRGAGNHLDIMLRRVAAPTPVQSSQPVVHGQELKGSFRYMADAALFEDCRSGKSFPVAMEGAYIELERAYLDSSVEPPDPLLVTIRGRMLERPGMEEGTREVHVIVDEFLGVSEDSDCTPNREASLENTRWKLVELGEGRRLAPGDTVTGAFFILRTGQGQVNGSGGCNNFFGSYEIDGDKLVFGALGNTMKMCPTGMDIEQAMMQALGETTRYAINGEVLSLYADDRVLARFEAEYL